MSRGLRMDAFLTPAHVEPARSVGSTGSSAFRRRSPVTVGHRSCVCGAGMNDFDRRPGAIDDPGMKGGLDPDLEAIPGQRRMQRGSTGGESDAAS